MNSDLLDDMRISEPSSAQAVTSNVAGVIDVIAEEAAESERRGRITDRTVRAMRSAGMFQMTFPSRVGGLEMTLEDQVRVVSAIARVDGGSAWNVGVLNATGIYAGRLGDEGYADLYPDRDRPTSGAFHPKGVAEKVSGGYMVTGKWDWGSGSYVADHIIGARMLLPTVSRCCGRVASRRSSDCGCHARRLNTRTTGTRLGSEGRGARRTRSTSRYSCRKNGRSIAKPSQTRLLIR